MKKFLLYTVLFFFLLATASAAMASAPFIPPFDSQHKILIANEEFYSGGAGTSERSQMQDLAKGFNLRLVFDTTKGAYLSSIAVKVQDAKGHVLIDTVSKGPWFRARLPAADNRLTATYDHHGLTQRVTLTRKPQTFILNWSL